MSKALDTLEKLKDEMKDGVYKELIEAMAKDHKSNVRNYELYKLRLCVKGIPDEDDNGMVKIVEAVCRVREGETTNCVHRQYNTKIDENVLVVQDVNYRGGYYQNWHNLNEHCFLCEISEGIDTNNCVIISFEKIND